MVGDEFSRKPYALAVQQGSPLKDQLNDAYVENSLFLFKNIIIFQHSEASQSKKAGGNEGKVVEPEWEPKGNSFTCSSKKITIVAFPFKNCDKEDEDTGGISIHNIGGVFIVIFIGIVLALVTLIAEYYYYKIRAVKPGSAKVGDSSDVKKVSEYDKKKDNKW